MTKLKFQSTFKKSALLTKSPKDFNTDDLEAIAHNSFPGDSYELSKYAGYDPAKHYHKFLVLNEDDNNEEWMVSYAFVFLGQEGLELDYAGVPAFTGTEADCRAFIENPVKKD